MLLMLYAPACCVLIGAGVSTCASLALSPLISTAWLGVAGIAYAFAGIPANPVTMFVPLLIVSLLVGFLLSRHRPKLSAIGSGLTPQVALLYIAAGTLTCLFVFASHHGTSMNGFIQQWDNDTHLAIIRAFADSQSMSSVRASTYLTAADAAINPFGETGALTGFYPAVYHELCALVILGVGISAPTAINVSIVVAGSVVFPVSMALCISEVFREDRPAILSGTILCCLFPAMPYALTLFGPLYPNLFAFALLPLGVALVFGHMNDEKGSPASFVAALLVTVIALVLFHPNAVFSLGVLTVPSVAVHVARKQRRQGKSRARAWGMGAGILAAAIAVWIALFYAPFLHKVVTNYWGTYASLPEALRSQALLLTSSYLYELHDAQPLLFALAAVGVITDIVRHRRPGLVASYVMIQIMCVVAASSDGFARYFLTGFWYTDSNRIAAFLVIPAVMFAAEGVSGICQATQRHLGMSSGHPRRRAVVRAIPALAAIALVSAEAVIPFHYAGVLSHLRYETYASYGRWNPLNSSAIRSDLQDIKEIVGDDTVANSTYDGSLYLYGTNDIRVLYRTNDNMANARGAQDTEGAQLMRTSLNQIATNESVRAEAERQGIRWVLQMDVTGRTQQSSDSYSPEDWAGIESIDENTPGFQLVYKDRDIRLYRVVE
jgi:uncharacterized membrane protein YecN with MAPEG domain